MVLVHSDSWNCLHYRIMNCARETYVCLATYLLVDITVKFCVPFRTQLQHLSSNASPTDILGSEEMVVSFQCVNSASSSVSSNHQPNDISMPCKTSSSSNGVNFLPSSSCRNTKEVIKPAAGKVLKNGSSHTAYTKGRIHIYVY